MNLGVDIRCLQDRIRTGVGEYAWQTLRHLAQNNSLSLTGFANAAGRIDLPAEITSAVKVRRGRVPNKLMNLMLWLKLGPSIDQRLKMAGSKLDALWLPNPSFAHVSLNMPTILTVHDLSFIHYPNFFPGKGKLWYFPAVRRLLNSGLPQKSLVVAVSQHTAEDVAQVFPQLKTRLRTAPPGLDVRYFSPPSPERITAVKERYHLPQRYLLSLGTIEPRKNYQLLLLMYEELLKRQPDFPCDLVIAGGWGWRFESIRALHAKLESRSRIKFIGYVPEEDKSPLYSQADLFLYPSLYEGIGLPPLEAMASGLPTITSHSSSLPEVVGDGGILLSPYLVEAWLNTVSWLITDNQARQELKQRGLARAKEFSWQRTAAAYRDFLNELVGK